MDKFTSVQLLEPQVEQHWTDLQARQAGQVLSVVHIVGVAVFRAFAGCPGKLIAQFISSAKEKDVIWKHAACHFRI